MNSAKELRTEWRPLTVWKLLKHYRPFREAFKPCPLLKEAISGPRPWRVFQPARCCAWLSWWTAYRLGARWPAPFELPAVRLPPLSQRDTPQERAFGNYARTAVPGCSTTSRPCQPRYPTLATRACRLEPDSRSGSGCAERTNEIHWDRQGTTDGGSRHLHILPIAPRCEIILIPEFRFHMSEFKEGSTTNGDPAPPRILIASRFEIGGNALEEADCPDYLARISSGRSSHLRGCRAKTGAAADQLANTLWSFVRAQQEDPAESDPSIHRANCCGRFNRGGSLPCLHPPLWAPPPC